jgi:predicted Fe-Mo cluster-binding NifX family protein
MIAIPARVRDGEVLLTTIFGRSVQLALINDEGQVEVRENPLDSGVELADWLVAQGVKTLVIRNMGANPYLVLRQGGVKVFVTPKNRAPITEILEDLNSGKLVEVTPDNMADYLRAGQHRHDHEHGDGSGHGHGQGRGH